MKTSKTVVRLSCLIIVLALVAAGTGLFWQDGGSPFAFTTLHGRTVQIYGQGLYHYDTVASAAQEQGQDAVTLFLGIPVLVLSLVLYRRGSLRGRLLLTGTLAYFLYTYASMAFYTAYNNLFLVYVALFSAGLFGFVLAFTSIDLQVLPAHFSPRLPHRGVAGFLFAVGVFLLVSWLGLIVPPLLQGRVPAQLESTTTLVIQVLDLGIIVPVAFLSGVLLLRRVPLGYLLAATVLIKFLTLGAAVTAMVVGQLLAGVPLGIGDVAGFPILTLIGIGMTIMLLRNVSDATPAQPVPPPAGRGVDQAAPALPAAGHGR
jgi:hypothetical protein